jgi:YidC/Oxa1 family membrane protein insertase
MFDWLYELLGTIIAWFSNTLGGGYYVVGIFFYALLFKLVLIPFTIKQQQNQIAMAKLTPKIELIKAKYKGRNDQPTIQKMQQEIMELQQAEGYNPLSVCLPLLIQMPIIIFLYKVIRNPLSYICKLGEADVENIYKLLNNGASADFKAIDQLNLVSQINNNSADLLAGYDLTKLPDISFFGVGDLGSKPEIISWLALIPIIAAALTWLSMFLSKKWNGSANVAQEQQTQQNAQMQQSTKMMELMMPAMTLFMAFGFSSMMGIYWIYQSALGILQTYLMSKFMPIPRYTEEELKAMRKAQKQAEKAQRQALKAQPKIRSLHYIDEDDYDTLPEVKPAGKNTKKADTSLPDIQD